MDKLKEKTRSLLKWSELIFKTDMVYLAKGGFWLGLYQVGYAVIAFGSSIFFANLIPKDLYGSYKFILAATGILSTLSLSGMGNVITQGVARGTEGIFKNSVKLTLRWGVIILVASLSASLYYFLKGNITLSVTMLIAGLALPLNNAYTLYGNYLSGKKDFKRVALYAIASQALITAGVIFTAYLTENLLLMIGAFFSLTVLTTLLAYRSTLMVYRPNEVQDPALIPYSKHLSLINFFGALSSQLDKLLVFHYLGAASLAIYSFSQAMPEQIKGVYKNLFVIVFPKYAALSVVDMRKSMTSKFISLTAITGVIVLAYIISAPLIFRVLFPKYMSAIHYSQIYSLGVLTIPGISLFANYFQLKKSLRTIYKINTIGNVLTVLITFVLIYRYGLLGTVVANGASWLAILLVHGYYFATDRSSHEIAQA